MRKLPFIALFVATPFITPSLARANQPPPELEDPYAVLEVAPPAPPAAVAPAPSVIIQVAPAAPVAAVPPAVPAPPQQFAMPPSEGPAMPSPIYIPPPAYQQRQYAPPQGMPQQYRPGYYYPPTGYAAPIYSYPPPGIHYRRYQRLVAPPRCAGGTCSPPAQAQAPVRARFFSFGARASALTINQEINGKSVTLAGPGVQLRFRTRGRFGMEAGVEVLTGKFNPPGQTESRPATPTSATPTSTGDQASPAAATPMFRVGPVQRTSVPVTLSALIYVFPNDDARVFNLYFLGGIGAISTAMKLTNPYGAQVTQRFDEFQFHVGIGTELRFKWFALQSDLRGVGLMRDDSDVPASYYAGVEGAPVPKNSWGLQGNLGAAFWF